MDKTALEPVYTLCSGIPSVYSLLFWNHSDQDIILCGTKTGAVYTWDLDNARITNKPTFEIGMSPCVSLSNSDDILVTQDKLGSVKLWQETPCSWTETKSFRLDHTGFCRVDVSNLNDNLAALPRHKGGLEIYNLKSYEKVTSFNDSDTDIYEQLGELMACKLITISGVTYVIAAYENEELCLWDLRKEGVVSKHKLPGCPTSLEFDNELGKGICGTSSSQVPIFCVDKAGTFSTCPTVKLKCRGVSCVRMKPDKTFVVAGCWNKLIQVIPWCGNADTPNPIKVHYNTITDICFSSKPMTDWQAPCLMAVASSDSVISLWKI